MRALLFAFLLISSISLAQPSCEVEFKPTLQSNLVLNKQGDFLTLGLTAFYSLELKEVSYPTYLILIANVGSCTPSNPCIYRITGNATSWAMLNLTKWSLEEGMDISNATMTAVFPYYDPNNLCQVEAALGISHNEWTSKFSNLQRFNNLKDVPCIPNRAVEEGECPQQLPLAYIEGATTRDANGNIIPTIIPGSTLSSTAPPTPPPSGIKFIPSAPTDATFPLLICASIFGILLAAAFASGQNPFFWATLEASRRPMYRPPSATSYSGYSWQTYAYGSKALKWAKTGYSIANTLFKVGYATYVAIKSLNSPKPKPQKKPEQGSHESGPRGGARERPSGGTGSGSAPSTTGRATPTPSRNAPRVLPDAEGGSQRPQPQQQTLKAAPPNWADKLGQIIRTLKETDLATFAFSNVGELLRLGVAKIVGVFDEKTGENVGKWLENLLALSFSPKNVEFDLSNLKVKRVSYTWGNVLTALVGSLLEIGVRVALFRAAMSGGTTALVLNEYSNRVGALLGGFLGYGKKDLREVRRYLLKQLEMIARSGEDELDTNGEVRGSGKGDLRVDASVEETDPENKRKTLLRKVKVEIGGKKREITIAAIVGEDGNVEETLVFLEGGIKITDEQGNRITLPKVMSLNDFLNLTGVDLDVELPSPKDLNEGNLGDWTLAEAYTRFSNGKLDGLILMDPGAGDGFQNVVVKRENGELTYNTYNSLLVREDGKVYLNLAGKKINLRDEDYAIENGKLVLKGSSISAGPDGLKIRIGNKTLSFTPGDLDSEEGFNIYHTSGKAAMLVRGADERDRPFHYFAYRTSKGDTQVIAFEEPPETYAADGLFGQEPTVREGKRITYVSETAGETEGGERRKSDVIVTQTEDGKWTSFLVGEDGKLEKIGEGNTAEEASEAAQRHLARTYPGAIRQGPAEDVAVASDGMGSVYVGREREIKPPAEGETISREDLAILLYKRLGGKLGFIYNPKRGPKLVIDPEYPEGSPINEETSPVQQMEIDSNKLSYQGRNIAIVPRKEDPNKLELYTCFGSECALGGVYDVSTKEGRQALADTLDKGARLLRRGVEGSVRLGTMTPGAEGEQVGMPVAEPSGRDPQDLQDLAAMNERAAAMKKASERLGGGASHVTGEGPRAAPSAPSEAHPSMREETTPSPVPETSPSSTAKMDPDTANALNNAFNNDGAVVNYDVEKLINELKEKTDIDKRYLEGLRARYLAGGGRQLERMRKLEMLWRSLSPSTGPDTGSEEQRSQRAAQEQQQAQAGTAAERQKPENQRQEKPPSGDEPSGDENGGEK